MVYQGETKCPNCKRTVRVESESSQFDPKLITTSVTHEKPVCSMFVEMDPITYMKYLDQET